MHETTVTALRVLDGGSSALARDSIAFILEASNGLTGVGEVCPGSDEEILGLAEELSVQVLGRSVYWRESVWHSTNGAAKDWGGRMDVAAAAVSAVDAALWDLAAKSLEVPCHALSGGRPGVCEVCLDCGELPSADAEACVQAGVDAGVRTFAFTMPGDLMSGLKAARAIRKRIGAEAPMILRAGEPADSVEQALEAGRQMDKLAPFWVEGLLKDGMWRELATVRKSIESAVAAGAETIGPAKLWRALEMGSADILTPDLAFCGGPTGTLKLASACELRGIRMTLATASTAATAMCAAQVTAARGGTGPVLIARAALDGLQELVPGALSNGFLRVSDAPGLGLPSSEDLPGTVLASFDLRDD